MWRWLRFSSRKEEEGEQTVATAEPENATSAEATEGLNTAGEPPTTSEALEKLFAEEPIAETPVQEVPAEETPAAMDAGSDETSASELPSAAETLEELFQSAPDSDTTENADTSAEPESPESAEPIAVASETETITETAPTWREETPQIPAEELPSAAHVLAELFDQPEAPGESTSTKAEIEGEPALEAEEKSFEPRVAAAEPEPEPETEPVPEPELQPEPEPASHFSATETDGTPVAETEEAQAAPAQPEASPEAAASAKPPYRDWAFEEKLASHREWVESQGVTGQRADLSRADLQSTELISVHLRFADLHDANLSGADLLLADLRDACLVRTNLEDACLVGANFEGANLEGASLETAMGLVPRQLAGANVRDASLPPQFLEFGAAETFTNTSRAVARLFIAMISASAACWLILWKTRDAQLLTDSSLIPFLHSRAAAAALPTVESYLILPSVLFILYLVFQYQLQKLWDTVLELPAIFPDGNVLGEREPAIVLGLLRTHFRWIDQDPSSTRLVEKGISIALAYWTVPVTLLLFWARYLRIEEVHGTILQAALAVVATGVAFYASTRAGRPHERWVFERRWSHWVMMKVRSIHPATVAGLAAAALLFLSVGTMMGVPHEQSRAPQYSAASVRRWAPTVFWWLGYDPYADLTEASISTAPTNWSGADDQVSSVSGPRLSNVRFRYAQGYGSFLANAHLWRANFEGAFLSQADMRWTDLGQGSLRFASLDGARMNHANLDRVDLGGADMRRVDLRDANMSYASLASAVLVDARLDGASLYTAQLTSANLTRANLERTDLRDAYLSGANLEHADLKQAYLWSAKLAGADLQGADLGNAILIEANLQGADLSGAQFSGTVLTGANLNDTILDGADLRGASSLNANQVCSAKTRRGVLLSDAMQAAVAAQCGAVQ